MASRLVVADLTADKKAKCVDILDDGMQKDNLYGKKSMKATRFFILYFMRRL
jgi:hypothetical protein